MVKSWHFGTVVICDDFGIFFSGAKSLHFVCLVKSLHLGNLSEWSKAGILALCQYGESDRTKGEFEQDVDETQFIHFN